MIYWIKFIQHTYWNREYDFSAIRWNDNSFLKSRTYWIKTDNLKIEIQKLRSDIDDLVQESPTIRF